MAKMGRPQKPYQTSWGEIVPGLAHRTDGRWRVVATGQLFTEHDERAAVARFRAMSPRPSTFITVARSIDPADTADEADRLAGTADLSVVEHDDDTVEVGYDLDTQVVWDWFRRQLLEHPLHVAAMTGIPQLANWEHLGIPKPPMKLARLLKVYREYAGATEKTQREVEATWNDWFVKLTGAESLQDLTRARLIDFRKLVVSKLKPSTAALYFGRIRTVLNTALKRGGDDIDAEQIHAVKLRMKVLYPPKNDAENDPHPITREDFHSLLDNVGLTDTPEMWRAMLLMGLNAALYMEDLCSLKWKHINLANKTFHTKRKKKGHCDRAAVLWDETVDALTALPRRGDSPYVFTSAHGTRYNRNTKINDFRDFRTKAGVPHVKWSHLRDGAYTAACNAKGVEETCNA